MLGMLPLTCDGLRHLSSLAEINTSACNGSIIKSRIDDNTLMLLLLLLMPPPPLLLLLLAGTSHRLLVSPTKHSAIFGSACKAAVLDWECGNKTLNFDENAIMPAEGCCGSAAWSRCAAGQCSRMMIVAAAT